ncbi:MAG: hypothetical protein HOE92_03105 [Euryarchaeota archaeon]|jgi:tRNA threonylcarbamoyladenosine modification (KEOPS) complex  Pcc1 subunit|nr:hypothetical protein [Euryarchaeota archaeon]MBT3971191.1 hypothetical protein [Euryarchaeota archaeon]MBT4406912.1 hypothetical protein [Euryarchaeota archaeon]
MGEQEYEVEITHEGEEEVLRKFLAAMPNFGDNDSKIEAEISKNILRIKITACDIKTLRSLGDKVMVAMAEIEDSL